MLETLPPGDYELTNTKRTFQVQDDGTVMGRLQGIVTHEGFRHVVNFFIPLPPVTIQHSDPMPIGEAPAEASSDEVAQPSKETN